MHYAPSGVLLDNYGNRVTLRVKNGGGKDCYLIAGRVLYQHLPTEAE